MQYSEYYPHQSSSLWDAYRVSDGSSISDGFIVVGVIFTVLLLGAFFGSKKG